MLGKFWQSIIVPIIKDKIEDVIAMITIDQFI